MSWIYFNKQFSEFTKLKRNVPGALIEILDGTRRKVFLIGDVNTSGSAEDGGKPFSDDTVVIRYQYIWTHVRRDISKHV